MTIRSSRELLLRSPSCFGQEKFKKNLSLVCCCCCYCCLFTELHNKYNKKHVEIVTVLALFVLKQVTEWFSVVVMTRTNKLSGSKLLLENHSDGHVK